MSMTVEKAISILRHMKNLMYVRIFEEEALQIGMDAIEEVEQYRAIGTVSEFKQLKEKATAKKPILNPICKCPICDHVLPYALVKYCSNCGTALDCSEGKKHTENSKWKESMMRTFLGSRK